LLPFIAIRERLVTLQSSKLELFNAGGGAGDNALKTRPFWTTRALVDGHKARIADGHMDR
jgi:hypothetical protein